MPSRWITMLTFLAVSRAHSAVLWDEGIASDLSSLQTAPTELGDVGDGSWEITASADAGDANNGPDGHDYAVFTTSEPWAIELVSLSLTNTSSVLIGIYNPETGDPFAFDFLNGPKADVFGQIPAGRFVFRLTPNGNVGQVSYSVRLSVGGAPSPVSIQTALDSIEDANFRDCVEMAANGNGWTLASEVTSLICSSQDITTARGVEQFLQLEELNLQFNSLTAIDVSANVFLRDLLLDFNQLTTIDVSANSALDVLALNGNQITTIDVSANALLDVLTLVGNQITTIDVSFNPILDLLDVRENPLTSAAVAYLESINGVNGLIVRFDPPGFVTDGDSDGILDYIDPNPTVPDAMISRDGADYVLTILGSGRVASLQSSSLVNISGPTSGPIQQIAHRLYEQLQDDFDFIIVGDQWDSGFGSFLPFQNQVSGIGKPVLDIDAAFGSAGRLQGVVLMASWRAVDGGWSLHELGHRWGNYLSLIPSGSSHWDSSSVGGLLGGWAPGTLQDLGGGQYRALDSLGFGSWARNGANNTRPYSKLELYLMGLIPADEVDHDVIIANGFAWVDKSTGTFQASSFTTVTMEQIIAAEGPRIPGPESSQREFRALLVRLTDDPLTLDEWREFDRGAYRFGLKGSDGIDYRYNFWEATGGRASLEIGGLIDSLIQRNRIPIEAILDLLLLDDP